jgi:hypothetical protein
MGSTERVESSSRVSVANLLPAGMIPASLLSSLFSLSARRCRTMLAADLFRFI